MTVSPVPVVVLATTDAVERDVALLTALVDTPGLVAVVQELSADNGDTQLVRRVLTAAGEQRVPVPLEHACAGCAMREDAVPAIVELLDDDPTCVVLALPLGAEILPATRTLHAAIGVGVLHGIRVAGTVVVTSTRHLLDALDDGDDAVTAQLIGADVVVATGGGRAARDVVDALRSPTSQVLSDVCEPWLDLALTIEHDDDALERRCDPQTTGRGFGLHGVATGEDVRTAPSGVWETELRSPRAVHPDRLLRVVQALGAAGTVSRGRFWVPNRPDAVCGWDAVCGQVSIGVAGSWDVADRETYLHVVGFDADPAHVREAFEAALLTAEEHAHGPAAWLGRPDPLRPYLGDPADLHDLSDIAGGDEGR